MDSLVDWQFVRAYAETKMTQSLVGYPVSTIQCIELLELAASRGMKVCPVGGGNTWGDMILNNGHIVLNTSKMNKILRFDRETGDIVVQPGVSFGEIFEVGLPNCWSLCSTPGGMSITIGGAISNNVHGKDGWSSGSFGNQGISMKLLISSGDILDVHREKDQKLFEAVVGGMGLLGVIVEATLKLKKIPSPFVNVSTIHVRNLRESIELLDKAKTEADFSFIWADAFSRGEALGRGFIKIARWVESKKRPTSREFKKSSATRKKVFGVLPARLTWTLGRSFCRPLVVRKINTISYLLSKYYYRMSRARRQEMLFTDFNWPYEQIPDVKIIYRPLGFLEFQPLIPKSAGIEAVEGLFSIFQHYGCEPFLCGIKAHNGDNNMISFSGDGYSIGGMFPVRGKSLDNINRFSRAVCEYTLSCGGKIYLAKDEYLSRDIFEKMYPRYKEFLDIKQRVDPVGLFSSDMYRRLLEPLNN